MLKEFRDIYQSKTRLQFQQKNVYANRNQASCFLWVLLVVLFYLQISENIKYRSLSDKNRLREWKVPLLKEEL